MDTILPEQAKKKFDSGECVIVDVREAGEYQAEHIPGSVHIPLSFLSKDASKLPKGQQVVLCCKSGVRAKQAQAIMANETPELCSVLEGGILAWKKSAYPIEANPSAPISIQRQVQIAAGSLVAIGTLLGILVSPWFLAVPAFVGSGLVFAGISDTCAMAALLMKLPYNK